jgi:hypothetical protein
MKRLVRLSAADRPEGQATRPLSLPDDETVDILLERGVTFLEEARKAYFERLAPAHGTAAVTEVPADDLADEGITEEVSAAGVQVYAEAEHSNDRALLEIRLRERLHGLLQLPALESHFTEPWTPEARTVLPTAPRNPVATAVSALVDTVLQAVVPSHTPALPPETVWGTALAWSLFASARCSRIRSRASMSPAKTPGARPRGRALPWRQGRPGPRRASRRRSGPIRMCGGWRACMKPEA